MDGTRRKAYLLLLPVNLGPFVTKPIHAEDGIMIEGIYDPKLLLVLLGVTPGVLDLYSYCNSFLRRNDRAIGKHNI